MHHDVITCYLPICTFSTFSKFLVAYHKPAVITYDLISQLTNLSMFKMQTIFYKYGPRDTVNLLHLALNSNMRFLRLPLNQVHRQLSIMNVKAHSGMSLILLKKTFSTKYRTCQMFTENLMTRLLEQIFKTTCIQFSQNLQNLLTPK